MMATATIHVDVVYRDHFTCFWIGSRMLGFLDRKRKVYVDMWDPKIKVIVRPGQ
jgi:hypothetical protein